MRNKLILCLCVLIAFSSCRKMHESNTTVDFNSLSKIDSINTLAVQYSQLCDELANALLGPVKFHFEYDLSGRIIKLEKFINNDTSTLINYYFTYNSFGDVVKIISQTHEIAVEASDSTIFSYPSTGITEASTYVIDYGTTIYTIYKFRFQDTKDSTSILVTQDDGYGAFPLKFKAVLNKNTNGDISVATYFRNEPNYGNSYTDTSTVIKNEYYTALNNPFYSIYQRLPFPLFFLLRYGGLSVASDIIDLAQFGSKHCISNISQYVYSKPLCVPTSQIFLDQYTFPSAIYQFSGSNITSIVSNRFFPTLTGNVNINTTITYK